MSTTRKVRRSVTIIESGSRWLWAEHGLTFRSLEAAINADDKDAKKVADGVGGIVVTMREFISNTATGRAAIGKATGDNK